MILNCAVYKITIGNLNICTLVCKSTLISLTIFFYSNFHVQVYIFTHIQITVNTHHVFTSFKIQIKIQSHTVYKHAHVQTSVYTDKQTHKYTNTVKYFFSRLFLRESLSIFSLDGEGVKQVKEINCLLFLYHDYIINILVNQLH